MQKNDINDIINKASNNNFYTYLGFKTAIIFHKFNTEKKQDGMIIAVNEKELYINSQKINTIILINSTYEIKFRGIIYNFVKLFFENNNFNFNEQTDIYNFLITMDN